MRLAYVSAARFPSEKANSRQTALMCHWFVHAGVETTLVVPLRSWQSPECENLGPRDLFKFYSVTGFNLVCLPTMDLFGPEIAPLEKYVFNPLFLLSYGFHVFRWARKAAPHTDLFYVRNPVLAWMLGLAGVPPAKLCLEAHSVSIASRWIWQPALNACGWVVAVTQALERELTELGFKGKAFVVPDAVDIEQFESTEHLFASGDKIVGYFGRFKTMEVEKGLYDTIQAFALVRKSIANTSLYLVGGSKEDVAAYREYAQRLGVGEKVFVCGFVHPSKIPACINSFDVCVLPLPFTKHFAYYASPTKLFEYMAAGKPIVATDLPSTREVLEDGKNAILVEPSNPAALANGLLKALQDPVFAGKIARQARVDVTQYTWENRAKAILGFLGGGANG